MRFRNKRISVRALAPAGEGIEPTERSSSGETSRAKKKSKTADFCTALAPDSENTELAEPIRLENEAIRAWKKSKTVRNDVLKKEKG